MTLIVLTGQTSIIVIPLALQTNSNAKMENAPLCCSVVTVIMIVKMDLTRRNPCVLLYHVRLVNSAARISYAFLKQKFAIVLMTVVTTQMKILRFVSVFVSTFFPKVPKRTK